MLQKVEIFTCSSNNKVFGSKSIGLRFFQSQYILQGQNDSELVKIIIHYSLFIIHYSAGDIEFLPSLWNEQIDKFSKRNQLAKIAMSPLLALFCSFGMTASKNCNVFLFNLSTNIFNL